jgi:hypothetical protein
MALAPRAREVAMTALALLPVLVAVAIFVGTFRIRRLPAPTWRRIRR